MIGQVSNGNWTTLLGEKLVYDVLKILGENPRKPIKKNGYQPDWETDNYIIEVKLEVGLHQVQQVKRFLL